ncbi:MAG: hypothetical protein ACPL28_11715 [bacterium]
MIGFVADGFVRRKNYDRRSRMTKRAGQRNRITIDDVSEET